MSRKEDDAFEVQEIIQNNEKKRRKLFMENAQLLSLIKKNNYHHYLLGDPEAPWSAFLSQTEIFYTRSQIDKMIRIYEKLTTKLLISPLDYSDIPQSRLIDILPIITKEDFEDWFSKAKTLTGRDWRIEIRQTKGLLTEEDEHEHNYEDYLICKDCGAKHKTDQNESGDK